MPAAARGRRCAEGQPRRRGRWRRSNHRPTGRHPPDRSAGRAVPRADARHCHQLRRVAAEQLIRGSFVSGAATRQEFGRRNVSHHSFLVWPPPLRRDLDLQSARLTEVEFMPKSARKQWVVHRSRFAPQTGLRSGPRDGDARISSFLLLFRISRCRSPQRNGIILPERFLSQSLSSRGQDPLPRRLEGCWPQNAASGAWHGLAGCLQSATDGWTVDTILLGGGSLGTKRSRGYCRSILYAFLR